jgi:hypothetical protein
MDKNKIEIKARHHSTDAGFCREIWQGQSMAGKTLWLMRDTQDGHWAYLSSGPDGYCEPESRISGKVDILICNNDWEVFYRTGNDRARLPDGFPTFDDVCEEHWNKIKQDHLPTVGTPELRAWLNEVKPGGLSYFDSINWDSAHYKAIDPEYLIEDGFFISREDKGGFKTTILLEFDYLGRNYHIVRKANHHTMCNARFYEYSVMESVDGKFDGNYYWFGYGLINNK